MIRTYSALTSDLNANPGRLQSMQQEAAKHGWAQVTTKGLLTIVTSVPAAEYNL